MRGHPPAQVVEWRDPSATDHRAFLGMMQQAVRGGLGCVARVHAAFRRNSELPERC